MKTFMMPSTSYHADAMAPHDKEVMFHLILIILT